MVWNKSRADTAIISDASITPLVRCNWGHLTSSYDKCTAAAAYIMRVLASTPTNVSHSVMEELTGLQYKSQHIAQIITAETILQHSLNNRSQLEAAVAAYQDSHRLVQYVDFDMSDETPMHVSRTGDLSIYKQSKNTSTALVELTGLSKQLLRSLPNLKSKSTEQPTKILQSNARFSMLVQNNATSEFCIIGGTTIHPLQHLERTTAECLVDARQARSKPGHQTSLFESKVRLSALDQAASNPRYISGLPNPNGTWKDMTFFCEDHGAFNIIGDMGKTFVDADISGITHWGLTFNHPLGRAYCTQIMRDIVNDWLVIMKGPPPLAARNHSKAILRIGLCGQSHQFETTLHMQFWPNGDPFIKRRIEVWLPVGTEANRTYIVEAVARSLNYICFSSNQPLIKRHRWYGIYPGFSAYVLLQELWGIGPELLKRFRKQVQNVSSARPKPSAPSDGTMVATDAAADVSQSSSPWADASERQRADHDDPEIHRCKATAWSDSEPGARCKIFRMAIEPMRQYQATKAHYTSKAQHKRCQIANVLATQGQGANLTEQIPFYAVISGKIEDTALGRLDLLMNCSELWDDLMSDSEKNLENAAQAFMMIARHGSQIKSKMQSRRRKQPMKTLLVDLKPELEGEIVNNSCEHMHTAWSLDHCNAHLGAVSAEERRIGYAKRLHICMEAETTVMELENLHASFRRKLKLGGVQTHKVTFADLAASFTCDRARSREGMHAWRDPTPANQPTAEDAAGANTAAGDVPSVQEYGDDRDYERGGGGGLWRCFVREESLGTSGVPDFRAIADKYRNHTSPADKDRLRPIAAEATKRHAAGENTTGSKTSSFGPTTREIDRALSKRKAEAMFQQMGAEAKNALALSEYDASGRPLQAALDAAHRHAQVHGGTFDSALKEGKFVLMNYSKMRNLRLKELEEVVRKWCAENCSKMLDKLVDQMPAFVNLIGDTVAVPPSVPGFLVFNYRPEIAQLAAASTRIYEQGKHFNLSSVFQERFKQRCSPFLHEDACKAYHIPDKTRDKPCLRHGKVLCKGDGLQLWSQRNALLKNMKETFKPKSALRAKLGSSQIVAKFTGKGEPITNPWAKKEAIAQGRRIDGTFQEVFFHVAHMAFNPYGPSWMEMHRKVDDPAFCKLVPGSVPVTAANFTLIDELDGIELLDRSLQWTVQWCYIATNQKRVTKFVPGNQHLMPLPMCPPSSFWPRPRGRPTGTTAASSVDDNDTDEDEEALALEDEGDPDDPDDLPAEELEDLDYMASDDESEEETHAATAALAKVTFHNGSSVSFYRDGRFEAVCRHCLHLPRGRCRLTRTCYGTGNDTCPAQGRPVGLLASWILSQEDFADREDHCDAFAVYSQSHEQRCFAREQLKMLPDAADLCRHERKRRDGEPEEPEDWA